MTVPLYGVLSHQHLLDLLPALLLMIRITGQAVEDPGDTTGSSVMSLKHKSVHLCSNVFI